MATGEVVYNPGPEVALRYDCRGVEIDLVEIGYRGEGKDINVSCLDLFYKLPV